MITLSTLLISVAIAALVLSGLTIAARKHENMLMTYVQHFCGVLFLFSGAVKAVDPLGTAYKMEQYFGEFESTFSYFGESLGAFFPWMAQYAVGFSVFMIVFELALAMMLILGWRRKLTAWLFLALVVFFTVLTGFTYLTGYVPQGVNFFEFSGWTEYVKTNMKVTDCGCFGDFLKLEPKTSFFKDVFLMVPALMFVFGFRKMHQIGSTGLRTGLVALTTIGSLLFCFANYSWNIPMADFRPFKVGTDIPAQRALEEEAMSAVEITAYKVTNKDTGEKRIIPFDQYMKEFKNYPKEEWKLEQVKSEPAIEMSKISEFELQHPDGHDVGMDMISQEGYHFFVVSKDLKVANEAVKTVTQIDTTYRFDTLTIDSIVRVPVLRTSEVQQTVYTFDESFVKRYTDVVNPVMDAAQKEGVGVFAATSLVPLEMVDDFRHATQSAYPFYRGDDILLKTIIRSNPGVLLLKDGVVVAKWHHKKFPDWETIKKEYIK